MTKKWRIQAFVITLSLGISCAFADTVTSLTPDWILLPNSITANSGTWAIAAQPVPNCGPENFNTCEGMGLFQVDHSFVITGPRFYTINDPEGIVSDLITISNVGGFGRIAFFSDPASVTPPPGFTNAGILCAETTAGCTGTFTLTTSSGATLTIRAASDNENPFDPFGFQFDSSDQIQISGATPVGIPEPSAAVPLMSLLVAFGIQRWSAIRRA